MTCDGSRNGSASSCRYTCGGSREPTCEVRAAQPGVQDVNNGNQRCAIDSPLADLESSGEVCRAHLDGGSAASGDTRSDGRRGS